MDFIKQRRTIPKEKRMLDLRNQRLTFIKNEDLATLLKHIGYIAKREIPFFIYTLIFEQQSLKGYLDVIKMMPLMIEKRKEINKQSKVQRKQISKWFK